MYEDYYRFTRHPFSLTPDPEFLYKSEAHEAALEQLRRGIRRSEGFFLLTGDVGTGKTTICRTLVQQLGRNVFSALVLNPFVTQEELVRAILQDFGVVTHEEARTGAFAWATKQQLINTLNDFLVSLAQIGASEVVVVDEAQNLSPSLLEGIRLLSNLETDDRKLLQILLVGQPELVTTLEADGMRQFAATRRASRGAPSSDARRGRAIRRLPFAYCERGMGHHLQRAGAGSCLRVQRWDTAEDQPRV